MVAALLPGLAGLGFTGPSSLQAKTTTVEGLAKEFNWLVGELQRIATVAAPQRKRTEAFSLLGGPQRSKKLGKQPKGPKESITGYHCPTYNTGLVRPRKHFLRLLNKLKRRLRSLPSIKLPTTGTYCRS